MAKRSEFRPDLRIFGVPRNDPGWIYIVKNRPFIKIGKTKNPERRLGRDARTWLPDLEVIGVKPFWNITFVERSLHVAWVRYWYDLEWYKIDDEHDQRLLIEGFLEFYDEDRDMNSVDFVYWMNSTGMSEFYIERGEQRLTLPKFRIQESTTRRAKSKE